MKQKIKEAIKNKYKNLGLGEKAIDAAAAYLEASIKEESEIETGISGVEPLLKAFQSETDAIRTAKSAAEKRIAEIEERIKGLGGTVEKPNEQVEDKGMPEWAGAILESNKKLAEKINMLETEKAVSTRKQKLETIVSKLPENLRKPYLRMDVKNITDEDFEKLTSDVSGEVEEIVKETASKGAVFGRPASTPGKRTDEGNVPKEQLDEIMSGIVRTKNQNNN